MMNIEHNNIPLALLEQVKPQKAAAIRAHHAAGKPLQYWNSGWRAKPSEHILYDNTVYRAAPGSTDRKPKKPKPTPLVVKDWYLVSSNVEAMARDGNGDIVFLGQAETPQWRPSFGGHWSGDVVCRLRPEALTFIDPGTCDPDASLVFRPGV